ncbi:hypothetical protein HQ560_10970, partial [bacterium]|nr:hypothetical protein [bacterium]
MEGPAFGPTRVLGDVEKSIKPGRPFDVEITRKGTTLSFIIDGKVIHSATYTLGPVFAIAFRPWRATIRLHDFSAAGNLAPVTQAAIDALQQEKPQARPQKSPENKKNRIDENTIAALRMAIEDLRLSFPDEYKGGAGFLARLDRIVEQAKTKPDAKLTAEFIALKREALQTNPLLDFERLLIVRRRIGPDANRFSRDWSVNYRTVGIPDTGSGNTILPRKGFDNEIAILSPVGRDGSVTALHKTKEKVFVGDVDLHWDAGRMLFSSLDSRGRWQIFEMKTRGNGPRQITP